MPYKNAFLLLDVSYNKVNNTLFKICSIIQWIWLNFGSRNNILTQHLPSYLSPEATEGPCTRSEQYPGVCMDRTETWFCSPTSGSFTVRCKALNCKSVVWALCLLLNQLLKLYCSNKFKLSIFFVFYRVIRFHLVSQTVKMVEVDSNKNTWFHILIRNFL